MLGFKPAPKTHTTLISVRIPDPTLERVDNRATDDDRNRSQMVIILLRYALDNMPHPKR